MVYTEIKSRNNRKYYYRTSSVREGNKIKKKRVYLGGGLTSGELAKKEIEADKSMLSEKANKKIGLFKDKIIKILRKYHVKKAGIFGSYARGEQRKNSDIDIIIAPPKDMGLEFVGLALELEKKLKKKVDLLSYNGIHNLIKKRVLEEERRIIDG